MLPFIVFFPFHYSIWREFLQSAWRI